MSLYIGKDSYNKSCMILSSNSASESTLKNSSELNVNNFSFDSRMPLLYINKVTIPISLVETYSVASITRYRYTSANIPTVYTNDTFLVYVNNIHVTCKQYRETEYIVLDIPTMYFIRGDTSIDLVLPFTASTIDIYYLPFSFTGNGYTGTTLIGGIQFNRAEFKINEIDYFKSRFLSSSILNSLDDKIVIYGHTYQIINSNNTYSNSLDISYSGGNLTIGNGGKKVFDSSISVPQFRTLSASSSIDITYNMSFASSSNLFTIGNLPTGCKFARIRYYPSTTYHPTTYIDLLVDTSVNYWVPTFVYFITCINNGSSAPGNIMISMNFYNGVIQVKNNFVFYGEPRGGAFTTSVRVIGNVLW